MGLTVGGRYLVSAGFVSDEGSSLGNLAIWALDGERATIVPGLYKTAFVSPAITGVRTLGEALGIVGVEQAQPTELPRPAAPSGQVDWSTAGGGRGVDSRRWPDGSETSAAP